MNTKNLIIYQFTSLTKILNEIKQDLNFNILEVPNEKLLFSTTENIKNYLIVTKNIKLNFKNKFIIKDLPIKIFKLVEQLNIEFIKNNFNHQSKIKLDNYIIDLNSREIFLKNLKTKLTEKELKTIIYLSKENKPIGVSELQSRVWGYYLDAETHTVETHIYRLRQKILKTFNDENFIISSSKGYKIKNNF